MNQATFPAPKNAPEPWNFSSTDGVFSGQFLLNQFLVAHGWLVEHAALLSAVLGLVGVVLVGVTWLEFQSTLEQLQMHLSEEHAPLASEVSTTVVPISATTSAKLRAHIAGAVRKPGVYELSSASVVQDLVTLAGGLSGLVWQDYLDESINLAAPLMPNQKVWIPSLAQKELLEPMPLEPQYAGELSQSVTTAATDSAFLSINTASVAELDTLAGIGQKRAEDIVANRPYAAIEELTSKAGVPTSIVSKLANQLKL